MPTPDTAFPDDRERDVRAYLKARLKAMGGELRKVRWTGRNGAPDELVMLPWHKGRQATVVWVELKRPGEEPRSQQWREIAALKAHGQNVLVIASREDVDKLFNWHWA